MRFTWVTIGAVLVLGSGWAGAAVIINELHTNPDLTTEPVEFIELHNTGATEVSLSGWYFSEGVFYTFPAGARLPAGGYVIVAQNLDGIRAKWCSGRLTIPSHLILGPYGGALDAGGEAVVLRSTDGRIVDKVEYRLGFPWPTVGEAVPETLPGSGRSMQLVNPGADNDLGGSWRSALPTPAAQNRVYAADLPPHIRQVSHSPQQPRSGEVVTITAKITDPDGVASVTLRRQLVDPGAYLPRNSPQYVASWTTAPMRDDGLGGDARAGDDVYTVQIPGSTQTHRRLVRYQIVVADRLGNQVTVPYSDDPQPNFAYFVYDGVPAWRGAVQPGVTPVMEFPAPVMRSLPVYHLISRKYDVEACMWLQKYAREQPGRKEFRWYGTLVYDGQVYDHIRYRARGGIWRHAMGKTMLKVDFGRGRSFQAHDDYGRPYRTTWDKLNLSACIQQGNFGQRGEQGMFEALSFRLFNLAGCPASNTNYVHLRIIDEPFEDGTLNAAHPPLTTRGTQYDGDFWGLYLAIEQMDGRFLDEHDLPDGNLFKMDNSVDELNNHCPPLPADGSDLWQFLVACRGASESWWRQNVNLDSYYGHYAIQHAVHHGDVTEKNWYLYHDAQTNQWRLLPWDVDLSWTTYYICGDYGGKEITDPFSRAGVLQHNAISIENRNRLREIIDLLFNPEQMNRLIDEYAAIIDPPGGLSMADADRAMWDYHWVMNYAAYPQYLSYDSSQNKAGQGRFYQKAASKGYERSFDGMVRVLKDYVAERMSYMNARAADSAIPYRPTISSTAAAGFPINGLTFRTDPFRDPQGSHTFAAMQWRIAEVTVAAPPTTAPAAPASPLEMADLSLVPDNSTWKYWKGRAEPSSSLDWWRGLFFSDSAWEAGRTPIGFGEAFIRTPLNDMRNGYTTIYLRKTFNASDFDGYEQLILEVQCDDGVNLWINGKLAYQANASGEDLPHTATAVAAVENSAFASRDLGSLRTWLRDGTNVIAVQVLNASRDSDDCFFDARLFASNSWAGSADPPSPPPADERRGGKYEIDAVWQSEEIRTFSSNVTIPAAGLKPSRTYRVRCRMKDNTGRWSQWSEPVAFTAGAPAAAPILTNLRVTELMYNPPVMAADKFNNDEFEFIELKNIGAVVLDLRNVFLTGGVSFHFSGSAVTSLQPDAFVLVVRNRPVFLSRYGSGLSGLVAGEYDGKLANEGESLSLIDLWNGPIAEFTYDDGPGWPAAADGDGYSLVPVDWSGPGHSSGSLNDPARWRASTEVGGSPGRDDPPPQNKK